MSLNAGWLRCWKKGSGEDSEEERNYLSSTTVGEQSDRIGDSWATALVVGGSCCYVGDQQVCFIYSADLRGAADGELAQASVSRCDWRRRRDSVWSVDGDGEAAAMAAVWEKADMVVRGEQLGVIDEEGQLCPCSYCRRAASLLLQRTTQPSPPHHELHHGQPSAADKPIRFSTTLNENLTFPGRS